MFITRSVNSFCLHLWWHACLLLVLLPALTRLEAAPKALLSAEIASHSPPPRSAAPIVTVWKLSSQSTGLLEGHLELAVRDGLSVLTRVTSDPVTVASGDSLQRVVIPPFDTDAAFQTVYVELQFVGKQQTFDLGTHPLRVPNSWQRALVVGVAHAEQSDLREEQRRLVDAFRLETLFDPGEGTATKDSSLSTYIARFQPEELSADPLMLCSFDLLLLMESGLTDLREGQLRALERWVDAGGSVCLVPGRSAISPSHLACLQRLASLPPESLLLALDASGRLLAPSAQPTGKGADHPAADTESDGSPAVLLKRHGLGRVAIVRCPLEELSQPERNLERRQMQAFLWKFRSQVIPPFLTSGRWGPASLSLPPLPPDGLVNPANPAGGPMTPEIQQAIFQQQMAAQRWMAAVRPQDVAFASVPLHTGDHLLEALRPQNLRIVPLSLMAAILVVYFLLIGPVDYFLLGAIRRRKWTWALFPAASIIAALGTVWLTNTYMEISETRRTVMLLDVGKGNRIARSNRFELLFESRQTELESSSTYALLTPMDLHRFCQATWFAYQQAAYTGKQREQFELVGRPHFTGRVPAQYSLTQVVPQWTPQLNRTFALTEPENLVEFDWDQFADSQQYSFNALKNATSRQLLLTKLQESFGQPAAVIAMSGGQFDVLQGDTSILQTAPDLRFNPMRPAGVPAMPWSPESGYSTFLRDVTTYPSNGFFQLISQISPTGGIDFEDLALLDPTSTNQWLLIVVQRQGSELRLYRKLYTSEAQASPL